MNSKNKHDSSNNFSLIGKKRSQESEANEKIENGLIKKNSFPKYDSISGLYKNIFGFDWTDSIFKNGQNIIDNISPEAIIFTQDGEAVLNLATRDLSTHISLTLSIFLQT